MVFSSPLFLFGFLPLVLLFYFISPRAWKNAVLLTCSLLFYAWGEVFYIGVMLISIASNYFVGRLIGRAQANSEADTAGKIYIVAGVFINVALLVSFKYANFIADNLNVALAWFGLGPVELAPVHLPLGISFFTFQALSYIVDVYRRKVDAQRKMLDLALYISLFPQLIAGPIVRYADISLQITNRTHSVELFASGVQRFVYGLAKKTLIANPLGEVADSVFAMSGNDLTMPLAWVGILAYTLQIFFDFSGYSDMAIGLGRMFGFRFHENFNYPYIALSIREFWRRWHISLSSWFRDYVYIPLGGNRVPVYRVYANLLVVFVLTGFWHGASWNFLIWGLFHGVFLAAEHAGMSNMLSKLWRPLQHVYLLMIVIVGWVFFRAETLPEAIDYLRVMFGVAGMAASDFAMARILTNEALLAFLLGALLCLPVYPYARKHLAALCEHNAVKNIAFMAVPRFALVAVLLFLGVIKVASSTYNPFIYFRF